MKWIGFFLLSGVLTGCFGTKIGPAPEDGRTSGSTTVSISLDSDLDDEESETTTEIAVHTLVIGEALQLSDGTYQWRNTHERIVLPIPKLVTLGVQSELFEGLISIEAAHAGNSVVLISGATLDYPDNFASIVRLLTGGILAQSPAGVDQRFYFYGNSSLFLNERRGEEITQLLLPSRHLNEIFRLNPYRAVEASEINAGPIN